MNGLRITIRGIVQGVGFRPYIYTLAHKWNLKGWVINSAKGVEIEVTGPESDLAGFLQEIPVKKPPLARIDDIKSESINPDNGYTQFEIRSSQEKPGDFIPISPDVSICDDCRNELFDPGNRRFRYPFINCTNCGPRFTIIKNIPYDRPFTTMSSFEMCPDCREEYENPLDRRFHAQPIACPKCGPYVWFEQNGTVIAEKENALKVARNWIKESKIIGIKGLGGYHLACDAMNLQAVELLRSRKKRIMKPFALMSFNLQTIKKHCIVSKTEEDLLETQIKPIVLLRKTPGSNIVEAVAPNQLDLGFMLPYTPLHLLLLEPKPDFPEVLVMTSGNLSEEPISYEDEDARDRLQGLADGMLFHNRPIHTRLDDSVVRIVRNHPYLIRRSRGYAPDPIILHQPVHQIFASGSDLKNTFCLTRGKYAFISHHIGDLENYATYKAYQENVNHYQQIFRIQPEGIACDMHPGYYSTRFAQAYQKEHPDMRLIKVQHHHAHLAACLADNHWESDQPVICFSFDGTGYGTDGAIWGGEVFVGGYTGFQRYSHLKYFDLPGGDMAIRKPARIALALLSSYDQLWKESLSPVEYFSPTERDILQLQLQQRINTVYTSSMGRLFDAISSILNICHEATYEGQAAIELETHIDPDEKGFYDFSIENGTFSVTPLLDNLLSDLNSGIKISRLSAKFHNSINNLVIELANQIRRETGIQHVALSGGVWQNQYLLIHAVNSLQTNQFTVLTHKNIPTNDGGISLGQAMIANAIIALE